MVLTDWRQNVPRWAFWAVVAVVGIPLVLALGGEAASFIAMLLIVLVSPQMAMRLGDIVAKPVSFCLPGFRESLRRRYFYIALLTGLGVSINPLSIRVFLPLSHEYTPALYFLGVGLEMAAAFLLGMVACLCLGAYRIIFPRSVWHVLIFLAVLLPLGVPWVFGWAFEQPLLTASVCAVACVLIWFRLGDTARVQEAQRMTIEDAKGEQTRIGTAKAPAPPWVEDLFRGEMERRRHLGIGRYVCGSLYQASGSLFSEWRWALAVVIVSAIIADFVRSSMIEPLFVLFGLFVAAAFLSPTRFTLLVPGGRTERYWATLILAAVGSLSLAGIASVIALLSEVFAILLSAFFPWGNPRGLLSRGMGPAIVFLPCLPVPALLSVGLIGNKYPKVSEVLTGLALVGLTLIAFWYAKRPDSLGRELLAGVFVFGCIFFLFTLRVACRRWDVR